MTSACGGGLPGTETFGGLGKIHAHGFERGHWWLVAYAVARDASIAFKPHQHSAHLGVSLLGGDKGFVLGHPVFGDQRGGERCRPRPKPWHSGMHPRTNFFSSGAGQGLEQVCGAEFFSGAVEMRQGLIDFGRMRIREEGGIHVQRSPFTERRLAITGVSMVRISTRTPSALARRTRSSVIEGVRVP